MKVNFMDLKAQYWSIKDEIDEAVQNVINKTAFSSGPFVKSFEENFAKTQGSKYCVGVNSGTSALHIAMCVLGIAQGDEVIVPVNTFFATPEAVSLTCAKPVFVDCEAEYFNIDADKIEDAISGKTKAIIAVHLYGQPSQLDVLKTIAEKHNLLLIEDCAQAHLAEYKGAPVGTHGTCGCFSFYPGKNLGAYGEAGAVITNEKDLYLKMLAFRDHGSLKKYYHDLIGHNYRMDGMQGAVLDVKLKYLNEWTEKRRKNALLYRQYLENIENVFLPLEMDDVKHVYHLYVVRVSERDGLLKYLRDHDIYAGIHYPIPCHLQKAYSFMDQSKNKFPVSEKYAKEILSLPMYAELSEKEIEFVCKKIEEFYK